MAGTALPEWSIVVSYDRFIDALIDAQESLDEGSLRRIVLTPPEYIALRNMLDPQRRPVVSVDIRSPHAEVILSQFLVVKGPTAVSILVTR